MHTTTTAEERMSFSVQKINKKQRQNRKGFPSVSSRSEARGWVGLSTTCLRSLAVDRASVEHGDLSVARPMPAHLPDIKTVRLLSSIMDL